MKEGTGTTIRDYAKSSLRHTMTATGTPTWTTLTNGLQVLDFNSAHPDYLTCAAASSTDLNFITENFTFALWVNKDVAGAAQTLMQRGVYGAGGDGWGFGLEIDNTFSFVTYQNGSSYGIAYSTLALSISTWYMLVGVRIGTAKGRTYTNGIDNTNISTSTVMPNPTTSARDFHIGIWNTLLTSKFDGKLFFPRIWNRALAPEEIMYLFQSERKLLGV